MCRPGGEYLRMLGCGSAFEQPPPSPRYEAKLASPAPCCMSRRCFSWMSRPPPGPRICHLVRDFIAELRREAYDFLCTHNLDEADRLCDRIGVSETRLLVVDSPERLRRQVFGRKVVFHLHSLEPELFHKSPHCPLSRSPSWIPAGGNPG